MANSIKGFGFLTLLVVVLAAPVISSFYKYYYLKDYNFIIEAECDSKKEICFTRDCSNPDECPPNGLSEYKEFYIKAYDFAKCTDDYCTEECKNGTIQCEQIECDSEAGDDCTTIN